MSDWRPAVAVLAGWSFLLAVGRLHTGVSGLAWLGWCLTGAWWAWRQTWTPDPSQADPRPRLWLWGLLVFSVFMIVPGAFWQVPFKEREETWRMVLAAAATLALCRRIPADQVSVLREWVGRSAMLACVLGWLVVNWRGRDHLPTNAIPWAMGMAFWLAWLWPWYWHTRGGQRWLGTVALLLGVGAVIQSETRGAYWILPWLALTGAWWWLQRRPRGGKSMARALGLVLVLALTAHWSGASGRVWQRMQVGWLEWQQAGDVLDAVAKGAVASPEQGALLNASMGARRALWSDAWEGFLAHPWTGIGPQARQERIVNLAIRSNAPGLRGLGHMHNEYLNDMLDHGVWGLLALLVLLGTLIGLAYRSQGVARWQLAGLTTLHALGGWTNVNFAHNDYSLMLGMTVSLALICSNSPAHPCTEADCTSHASHAGR